MNYMLDTNICVSLIRKKPHELIARLTSHAPGEVGVSIVTVAELSYGAQKSALPIQNLRALEQFLLPLEVADFDQSAADAYGLVRAHLERQGTPIGSMDMMIGSHALSLGVVLVTNNVREFQRIPNLPIEDWLA